MSETNPMTVDEAYAEMTGFKRDDMAAFYNLCNAYGATMDEIMAYQSAQFWDDASFSFIMAVSANHVCAEKANADIEKVLGIPDVFEFDEATTDVYDFVLGSFRLTEPGKAREVCDALTEHPEKAGELKPCVLAALAEEINLPQKVAQTIQEPSLTQNRGRGV